MKFYIECGNPDCNCQKVKALYVEIKGEKFILKAECEFCGCITNYDLWAMWEDQGGEA